MNKVFAAALLTAIAGASSAYAIEPIQGSIPSSARLEKAPVGSSFQNQFYADGNQYRETYVVAPDHSVSLVNREQLSNNS
ncbi:hypothetical protein ACQQ2Q_00980 [Agrobacterium sp. ES01]|uniref:hypothetical protein n=1 Tax=Agrobacterium sp. ES01 TaxID=3420714 RepID=UPI003D0C1B44